MSSDSEDDIFGNAAKKLKTLNSKFDIKKFYRCEILSDISKIENKTDCVSSSTSINDLVILSGESESEVVVTKPQKARRRQGVRKSKRVSIALSNQIVDLTKVTESPVKSVQSKKKTKRKTKKQNSSDTTTRNNLSESIENIHTLEKGRRVLRPRPQCPTINIGNTAEYTDNSEDIMLFSSKPNILEDIVKLDDNEEVTVHVNWQNNEVFKFNLRKFQKFRKIFEFFAKKENVPEKRLYFEYDDVVFTCDDSPDSIQYNIAKFIEGGLNSSHLSNLIIDTAPQSLKPNSIEIKFQCQDFRKPYECTVEENEKLSLAMVKCAEHFEKPLNKLRFEFDGERLIGTTTAKELELVSGDCIDVKIIK